MVIRYAYLWLSENQRGLEEGLKDRPCAVLLSVGDAAGDTEVVVLPVTHTAPRDPSLAVEIPAATKQRLGLDTARSWIVLAEANRFVWPGPDIRPVTVGRFATPVFGQLPAEFFRNVRQRWLALASARRSVVNRSR
jgi:hypothetical protein